MLRKLTAIFSMTAVMAMLALPAQAFTLEEDVMVTTSMDFPDVEEGDLYYNSIAYLYNEGILNGNADGTFAPDRTSNRAEIVKTIAETWATREGHDADYFDEYADDQCFPDVPAGEWYTKYVCFMADKGMVKGYTDGSFKPAQTVTFVEGLKITLNGLGVDYEDTESEETWYRGQVEAAAAANYIPFDITGFNQALERAQMADMMARILKDEMGELDMFLGSRADFMVTYETLEDGTDVYQMYVDAMDEPDDMMTMDLVEIAMEDEDLSTFIAAVEAAGLTEMLQGDGPYTVFAPTNEAFDALPEGALEELLMEENMDMLVEILSYHVVAGDIMAGDLDSAQMVMSEQGNDLVVLSDEDGVMVNDAMVVEADVLATNGVIHKIDMVLMPEEMMEVSVDLMNTSDEQMDVEMKVSPGLVVTHSCDVSLIPEDMMATMSWEALAEWGDPMHLVMEVIGMEGVYDVEMTGAMAPGGETQMLMPMAPMDAESVCVTFAAMAGGTNDGLVVATAEYDSAMEVMADVMVYDAGTEENSDLNSGYEGGQPDGDKTDQENMDAGTPTDPYEMIMAHPQFDGYDPILEMTVM